VITLKKLIKLIPQELTVSLLAFLIISLFSIYSASSYLSKDLGNLVIKQLIWYTIGFIIIVIMSLLNREKLYKYSFILYLVGNILLIGLLIFAPITNGSKAWFYIPFLGSFQPSEFMKVILIITIASVIHYFDQKEHTLLNEFKMIITVFIITIIPSILTFLEPDTGVVIMYFIIMISMLFISGIRYRWFIIAFVGLATFIATVLILHTYYQNLFIELFGSKLFYRIDRLLAWQSGTGMQLENSLAAIGSSCFFCFGFNKTPIYFPEPQTDFIFATYASNFGFFGSLILISLIIYFDLAIINSLSSKTKKIDKYVIGGIIALLIYQQIQNIGMTIGLLPITGITLPFISYGGSSLSSYMIIIGLIFNINIQNKLYKN
jgi:rod shape determining protein RodA